MSVEEWAAVAAAREKRKQDDDARKRQAVDDAIAAIQPSDAIETMLVKQMALVYDAVIRCFNNDIVGHSTLDNLKYGTRLVGGFVQLADARDRHIGKPQQLVQVKHVHTEVGDEPGNGVRPDAMCGKSITPLRGENQVRRRSLQATSHEGQQTLPAARCQGRRAERLRQT